MQEVSGPCGAPGISFRCLTSYLLPSMPECIRTPFLGCWAEQPSDAQASAPAETGRRNHSPLLVPLGHLVPESWFKLRADLFIQTASFSEVYRSWQLKWQANHSHVVLTAAGAGVINCPILLSKVAQIKATHSKGMYSCLCYGLNNNRHGSDAFLV